MSTVVPLAPVTSAGPAVASTAPDIATPTTGNVAGDGATPPDCANWVGAVVPLEVFSNGCALDGVPVVDFGHAVCGPPGSRNLIWNEAVIGFDDATLDPFTKGRLDVLKQTCAVTYLRGGETTTTTTPRVLTSESFCAGLLAGESPPDLFDSMLATALEPEAVIDVAVGWTGESCPDLLATHEYLRMIFHRYCHDVGPGVTTYYETHPDDLDCFA